MDTRYLRKKSFHYYRDVQGFLGQHGSITESQMNGLEAILASADSLEPVLEYIGKRIERAQKTGQLDRQGFWLGLKEKMKAIQKGAMEGLEGENPREATLSLVQRFIQHLAAENSYRSVRRGRSDARKTETALPDQRQTGPRDRSSSGSRPRNFGAQR